MSAAQQMKTALCFPFCCIVGTTQLGQSNTSLLRQSLLAQAMAKGQYLYGLNRAGKAGAGRIIAACLALLAVSFWRAKKLTNPAGTF